MRRVFQRPYRDRWLSVLAAIAATILIWFQFGPKDGGGGDKATAELSQNISPPILQLVSRMPLADKIDGVLMLGFTGNSASAPMISELRRHQLGAVLVSAANWTDQAQGAALVAALRKAGAQRRRIQPLVVARQEGGPYRALKDLPPTQRELDIGDRGSPRFAQRWATETGRALRDAGFDMNLIPVADVASLDSPIADRAFSDDPQVSASMTAAAIRGCNAALILCAPSHFPGDGAASQSTEQGPATVSLDPGTLDQRDLAPFRAAISEGAAAVILSHAFFVAYDAVTPASLSAKVATGLLRDKLHFKGVAITDDLEAAAIRSQEGVPQAAVRALGAGADLLMISGPAGDQEAARKAILEAIKDGTLPARRLDQAVGRVLEMKRRAGLLKTN